MDWVALGQWLILGVFLLGLFWLAAYVLLLYFKERGNALSWLTKRRLVFAVIFFNATDWLTTVVGVAFLKGIELNPFLALFLDEHGSIEPSFHILKLVLGSVAFVSMTLRLDRPFILGIALLFAYMTLLNAFKIALVIF